MKCSGVFFEVFVVSLMPQSCTGSLSIAILYELLYKKVCSMDDDLVDACLKSCAVTGRDVGGECRSSEESDLDEDGALG